MTSFKGGVIPCQPPWGLAERGCCGMISAASCRKGCSDLRIVSAVPPSSVRIPSLPLDSPQQGPKRNSHYLSSAYAQVLLQFTENLEVPSREANRCSFDVLTQSHILRDEHVANQNWVVRPYRDDIALPSPGDKTVPLIPRFCHTSSTWRGTAKSAPKPNPKSSISIGRLERPFPQSAGLPKQAGPLVLFRVGNLISAEESWQIS